jgi:hypothetical protein
MLITPFDRFFSSFKTIYDIMPSTDRKLELKAKTSVAQTASQVAEYAKGLMRSKFHPCFGK